MNVSFKYLILLISLLLISCKKTTNDLPEKNVIVPIHPTEDTTSITIDKETYDEALNNLPPNISQFIPENYTAIDTTGGDLNLDDYNDMVLVIQKKDTSAKAKTEEAIQNKREILLLLGQKEASYKLAKKNSNAIYNATNGYVLEDPFTDIVVKNGYFTIEQGIMGGQQHWEEFTTFKYNKQKADWFLDKQNFVNYKFNDSNNENDEAIVVDFQKKKSVKDFGVIPFEDFNIEKK